MYNNNSFCFAIMANKGGRPQDVDWEHFVRVTKYGKRLARCVLFGYDTRSGIDWVSKQQVNLSFITLYCIESKTWTDKL